MNKLWRGDHENAKHSLISDWSVCPTRTASLSLGSARASGLSHKSKQHVDGFLQSGVDSLLRHNMLFGFILL